MGLAFTLNRSARHAYAPYGWDTSPYHVGDDPDRVL